MRTFELKLPVLQDYELTTLQSLIEPAKLTNLCHIWDEKFDKKKKESDQELSKNKKIVSGDSKDKRHTCVCKDKIPAQGVFIF